MRKVLLLAVSAPLLLSACVGPNFERPGAPEAATGYTAEPLPSVTEQADINGGAAQRFLAGQDVPGQWWKLFRSDAIDRMVDQALMANSSLGAAQATLRQAHYIKLAQIGTFFPAIDAQLTIQRQKTLGQIFQPPATTTSYGGAIGFSYVLDIFGGNRRQFEAVDAQEDYYYFQLQGTYLSLVANVILAAIDEASLRAQIKVTQDIIKAQTQELDLLNQQFQLGAVAKGDVLAQQTQLSQTMASLPPLEKQLAQVRNSLSVLLGRLPVQGNLEQISLDTLFLPPDVPLSVPARLVDQRPDVRASEALLHQASAQVGVATAALFPQFQITGNYSSGALRFGDLFTSNPSNITWGLVGAITQPIFHGGQLWYQRRASQAAYDVAAEQYRNTVLTAFSDVASALRILELDAQALKIQLEAERAARENFDITRERFRAGAISYLSMLDAERVYQQARILLVQAQANRFADTVLLFQALGGGWWNREYHPPMTEDEAHEAMSARDAASVPAARPVNDTTPVITPASPASSPGNTVPPEGSAAALPPEPTSEGVSLSRPPADDVPAIGTRPATGSPTPTSPATTPAPSGTP